MEKRNPKGMGRGELARWLEAYYWEGYRAGRAGAAEAVLGPHTAAQCMAEAERETGYAFGPGGRELCSRVMDAADQCRRLGYEAGRRAACMDGEAPGPALATGIDG